MFSKYTSFLVHLEWRFSLRGTLLLLLLFCGAIRKEGMFVDPGAGWHLLSGKLMWLNGEIIRFDTYSWTKNLAPWVQTQWLSDCILWKFFQVGGFSLLEFITTSILCVIIFIHALRLDLRGIARPTQYIALFLTALLLSIQWFFRPVFFSFLLFSVVLLLIEKIQDQKLKPVQLKNIVCFAFLFALWANLHSGFPFGLALLALATLASFIDQKYQHAFGFIVLGFFSLIGTFINPYFYHLHQNMIELLQSSYFMSLNHEWKRPNFVEPIYWPVLATIFITSGLACLRGRGRLSTFEWLQLIFFSFTAFQAGRYIPFYACSVVVPLSVLISTDPTNKKVFLRLFRLTSPMKKALIPMFALIVWLMVLTWVLVTGRYFHHEKSWNSYDLNYPEKLAQFLQSDLPTNKVSHILNHADLGGYLIWKLSPQAQVSIDDRNELYGEELYRIHDRFFRCVDNQALSLRDQNPEYIIMQIGLEREKELSSQKCSLPAYQEVYRDKKGVVLKLKGIYTHHQ